MEYYSKLERGALAGASAAVLDAIARAYQLDEAERAHLITSPGCRRHKRPDAASTPQHQTLDPTAKPAMDPRHD